MIKNNTKTADINNRFTLKIYSEQGALVDTINLGNNSNYMIGRGDGCDIQCVEAASLSRQHAELIVKDCRVFVRDMNSTHGTMVNSKVTKEAELFDGDVIQLGVLKFVLCVQGADSSDKEERTKVDVATEQEAFDFDRELMNLHQKCSDITHEVGKVIVGQHEIVKGILVCLLSQNHCLLIGVPGLAKTVLVRTFSKILGLDTQRIQFTPDLMPSDIVGSEILKKNTSGVPELEFSQGPVFTQLLLADEINRTPPKTQSALLEAMQERQVTVAMRSYHLPLPFCVIATQNPVEQEGTYPLPEAQQDRFMLCLYLDYPDFDDEVEIISRTTTGDMPQCSTLLSQNDIVRFQRIVKAVGVPKEQVAYAVALTRATRPGSSESQKAGVADFIDWGAGPRAGQALIRGAKALAALEGRPAVSRDDIKELVVPVLRHRISCNYRARAEGFDEKGVIEKIIKQIK
jgi:MoxR-like ATPase